MFRCSQTLQSTIALDEPKGCRHNSDADGRVSRFQPLERGDGNS